MALKDHTGLGDTVAAVAKKLALDKLAQEVAKIAGKDDCGCTGRQEKLNKLFPYSNRNENKEKSHPK